MSRPFYLGIILIVAFAACAAPGYGDHAVAAAQTDQARNSGPALSPQKAMIYSILLPGLGQRYINHGQWGGWGTSFALLDVGLWASLLGVNLHEDQVNESFRTLAASRADADIEGKDRTYFLNLATFRSSDDFLQTVLRNRAWDQIGYVEDPSFQWRWKSEEDFIRFRSQREKAESLGRRRTIIVAALAANRLISGITAAIGAGKENNRSVSLSLGPPSSYSTIPVTHLRILF